MRKPTHIEAREVPYGLTTRQDQFSVPFVPAKVATPTDQVDKPTKSKSFFDRFRRSRNEIKLTRDHRIVINVLRRLSNQELELMPYYFFESRDHNRWMPINNLADDLLRKFKPLLDKEGFVKEGVVAVTKDLYLEEMKRRKLI